MTPSLHTVAAILRLYVYLGDRKRMLMEIKHVNDHPHSQTMPWKCFLELPESEAAEMRSKMRYLQCEALKSTHWGSRGL